jgi:thymidylate kinase
MIILEGIRRSGKSYTVDVLKNHIPNLIHHKDLGMRIIAQTPVDPDSYAMGRDFALAQFLPKLYWNFEFTNRLLLDRAYWSTYVYGQCWRNNYGKTFFKNHIERVEETYGEFLKEIKIVFITLTKNNFNRIKGMGREKDQWEMTHVDYDKQYELYQELFQISKAKIFTLNGFNSDDYIVKTFNKVLNS